MGFIKINKKNSSNRPDTNQFIIPPQQNALDPVSSFPLPRTNTQDSSSIDKIQPLDSTSDPRQNSQSSKMNFRVVNAPESSKGVKVSIWNGSPLTSTGIQSLDEALGGGLVLGSMNLVIQDYITSYYQYFLNYFVAQGLAHDHAVAISSVDESPLNWFYTIPFEVPQVDRGASRIAESQIPETRANQNIDETIRIAWRYKKYTPVDQTARATAARQETQKISSENQAGGNSKMVKPYCGVFDLSKATTLDHKRVPVSVLGFEENESLAKLLMNLKDHIMFSVKRGNIPPRIVIRDLLSEFWVFDQNSDKRKQVHLFLWALKSMLRETGAVAIITISLNNGEHQNKLRHSIFHFFDTVIEMNSYNGDGCIQVGLGDYLGTLNFLKMSKIKSLKGYEPPYLQYTFKRGRKTLTIQPAFSAPDLDVMNFETGKSEASKMALSTLCGTKPGLSSNINF